MRVAPICAAILVLVGLIGAAIKNGLRLGLLIKIALNAAAPLDPADDIGELKA